MPLLITPISEPNYHLLIGDMMVSIQSFSARLFARSSLIAGACLVLAACRGGSSLPSSAQGIPAAGSAARENIAACKHSGNGESRRADW